MNKYEYWFCFVGPVVKESIPFGADFPLRMKVKEAVRDLKLEVDFHCVSSGWGVTENQRRRIFEILNEMPAEEEEKQNG